MYRRANMSLNKIDIYRQRVLSFAEQSHKRGAAGYQQLFEPALKGRTPFFQTQIYKLLSRLADNNIAVNIYFSDIISALGDFPQSFVEQNIEAIGDALLKAHQAQKSTSDTYYIAMEQSMSKVIGLAKQYDITDLRQLLEVPQALLAAGICCSRFIEHILPKDLSRQTNLYQQGQLINQFLSKQPDPRKLWLDIESLFTLAMRKDFFGTGGAPLHGKQLLEKVATQHIFSISRFIQALEKERDRYIDNAPESFVKQGNFIIREKKPEYCQLYGDWSGWLELVFVLPNREEIKLFGSATPLTYAHTSTMRYPRLYTIMQENFPDKRLPYYCGQVERTVNRRSLVDAFGPFDRTWDFVIDDPQVSNAEVEKLRL